MSNPVFDSLVSMLTAHFGTASALDSGNGVRFKSARKGKATVYHRDVADGNHAEVAFEVASMAERLRMPQDQFRTFVSQLRVATGRPVETNQQFKWPRVGVTSEAHVMAIREALERKFAQLPVS